MDKTIVTKLIKPKEKIGERFILNRNNSPSPVSYEPGKSFEST